MATDSGAKRTDMAPSRADCLGELRGAVRVAVNLAATEHLMPVGVNGSSPGPTSLNYVIHNHDAIDAGRDNGQQHRRARPVAQGKGPGPGPGPGARRPVRARATG